MAAAALAWIAFRNRLLPRWLGAASAAAVAIVVVPMLLTGLPGMPGVVGPFWLVVVSVGMHRHLRSV